MKYHFDRWATNTRCIAVCELQTLFCGMREKFAAFAPLCRSIECVRRAGMQLSRKAMKLRSRCFTFLSHCVDVKTLHATGCSLPKNRKESLDGDWPLGSSDRKRDGQRKLVVRRRDSQSFRNGQSDTI